MKFALETSVQHSTDVIPAKHCAAVREPGPTEILSPWVPACRASRGMFHNLRGEAARARS